MRPFSFPPKEEKNPWLLSKVEGKEVRSVRRPEEQGETEPQGEWEGPGHGVKAWTRWMSCLCVEDDTEPWEGPQNTP